MLSVSVLAALIAVAGGVAVTAARDSRLAVLGLAAAAVGSALVASPLPSSLAVAARLLGAALAAYLLWTAASSRESNGPDSRLGLAAEACAAGAAYLLGLAVRPVDPLGGLPEAQAAGFALLMLSVAPLVSRDALRVGMGVLLLALGGSLIVAAWSGQPTDAQQTPDLEQLVIAILLVGVAGATCLLAPSRAAETEDALALAARRAERHPAPRPLARPVATPVVAPRSVAPPVARPLAPPVVAPRSVAPPVARPLAPPVVPSLPGENALDQPPQPRSRPMTAEPDPDDWLAWSAPDAEPPGRSGGQPGQGGQGPQAHQVSKDRRP